MLLKRAVLEAIAAGRVTRVYRRWRRPTVRAGGTLRTSVGVLAIDAVERVRGALGERDARRAGHASLAELERELAGRAGTLYRIDVRRAGPDPRAALRRRARLSAGEIAELRARLERMDRAAGARPWTRSTLASIARSPATRAPELAARARTPVPLFKRRVRRLKELGLTESLDVGYRLSPRGAAFLRALERQG